MALQQQNQWNASLPVLLELQKITLQGNTTNTTIEFALATAYHRQFQPQLARLHYEKILLVDPHHARTLANLGVLLVDHHESQQGLELLQRALAADPSLEPYVVQPLAVAHQHIGLPAIAEQLLQKVPIHMRTAQYHYDLGVTLEKQGKLLEANVAYNTALSKDQNFSMAWHNVAALHQRYGNPEDSIRNYMNVLRIASSSPELRLMAMTNVGAAFEMTGDVRSALLWYDRALQLTPQVVFHEIDEPLATRVMLAVHKARAKRTACIWDGLESQADALMELVVNEQLRRGYQPGLLPFDSLLTTMDPRVRLELARQHSLGLTRANKLRTTSDDSQSVPHNHSGKLRVGYISFDFCDHPTAHLMEGLFAFHDRERLDIVAFGYGRDDRSEFRTRLMELMDEFVNMAVDSTEQSIEKIRTRQVDILMDAQGHTLGARPGIVAARPAPIIVNYLVYPGTSGAPFVDYLISDRFVTPPESLASHFSEKLVLLPHCYQVNYYPQAVVPGDRSTLWTATETATETERVGESESDDWFTFVNFNKIDKLEPSAFSLWLAILRRVPQSRLLLLDPTKAARTRTNTTGSNPRRKLSTSEEIKRNLRLEAEAQGIASDRLRFVPRVPKRDHLQRHRHGGLFLDTFVYSAHSTATDALYAGLPVLTLAGDTFASRVGVSLLENAGLPELITYSRKEFEELAVTIATERLTLVARLRKRLRGSSENHNQTDTSGTTNTNTSTGINTGRSNSAGGAASLPQLFRTRDHVAKLEEAQHAMATLYRLACSHRTDDGAGQSSNCSSSLRTAHLVVV